MARGKAEACGGDCRVIEKRTITSDGLALSKGETVSALEAGDLAVREEGAVLGLLGVALHGLGLDDLELKAVVGGGTENLECSKGGEGRRQHKCQYKALQLFNPTSLKPLLLVS